VKGVREAERVRRFEQSDSPIRLELPAEHEEVARADHADCGGNRERDFRTDELPEVPPIAALGMTTEFPSRSMAGAGVVSFTLYHVLAVVPGVG
jgi:hypothetical protein